MTRRLSEAGDSAGVELAISQWRLHAVPCAFAVRVCLLQRCLSRVGSLEHVVYRCMTMSCVTGSGSVLIVPHRARVYVCCLLTVGVAWLRACVRARGWIVISNIASAYTATQYTRDSSCTV